MRRAALRCVCNVYCFLGMGRSATGGADPDREQRCIVTSSRFSTEQREIMRAKEVPDFPGCQIRRVRDNLSPFRAGLPTLCWTCPMTAALTRTGLIVFGESRLIEAGAPPSWCQAPANIPPAQNAIRAGGISTYPCSFRRRPFHRCNKHHITFRNCNCCFSPMCYDNYTFLASHVQAARSFLQRFGLQHST